MDKKYLFIMMVLITGCQKSATTFNYFYFDTPIEVKIFDKNFPQKKTKDDIDQILSTIERKYSNFNQDSTLSSLNNKKELNVDDEFISLLNETKKYCELSKGKYNVTSGILIDAWSISNENNIVLDPSSLLVNDCNGFSVNENKVTLNENTKLDLGSVVKGLTGDLIFEYFKSNDIDNAIVNIGGNVTTIGEDSYDIGINEPSINENTNPIMSVEVENENVVTSGINQRYFEKDGVMYHHLIDCTTGFPHNSNIESVSVISKNGTQADILSTVLYLMDFEQAVEYDKMNDDIEAVFVTKDNKIYMSDQIEYQLLSDYEVIIYN